MGIKYLPTKKDLHLSKRFQEQREILAKIKKATAAKAKKDKAK